MARKPETTFIASVHKHLKNVHFEKTNNPYRSGMADVWYSGNLGDLWVEYKFIEKLPRSDRIVPNLSAQQLNWLDSRYKEGRNVAVVLGTKTGGVVYTGSTWSVPITDSEFTASILDRRGIALWISSQIGTSPCTSHTQYS